MKNHHQREDDPADAIRLREGERLATWILPARPSWMSKGEYKQPPATLELRLIDVNVNRQDFRPSQFTVTRSGFAEILDDVSRRDKGHVT